MSVPRHPSASLRGRLLVATQQLSDRNFFRTVVLMLEHGEGALGVVLNRPTAVPVDRAAPDWRALVGEPPVVFSGGPVEPTAAIALARSDGIGLPEGAFTRHSEQFGMVDLNCDPAELLGLVHDLRIFSGYAGWGAGQLEEEIGGGGWLVLNSAGFDPLTSDPSTLWNAALAEAAAGRVLTPGRAPIGQNN